MSDTNEITINVLLLGKTKSGKSSLGNSLLGSYEFESQFFPRSVTKECRLCRIRIPQFARRMGAELCLKLQVLDTPGSPHSSLNQEEMKQSVKRSLAEQFSDGLHMALLVLRADIPHCEEDNQHTVKLAEYLLGPEWKHFTTVIFTHGDKLQEAKMDEEEYLMLAPKSILALLENVHNQYIFRFPMGKTLHQERERLLSKILHFVRQNSYRRLQFK
ncbi:GTPase IMAP family member GIMD1 [Bombina bombina]|uniref:GTPase IMAP family member GIMD1 n=1 Tax=Bombina bombina TaxID=8345 RepID=UPI00235AA042|nr:GTPase IMAP family member GIMD1 [Bombina bombina]